MQGWISLHRKLLDKPIWKNSSVEHKVILITLLLMANHEQNEWEWKGKKFIVKEGQFITSLESIVRECGKGVTIQNVRSAIKRFEKLEFLTNETTKTGRLITIVNWSNYQDLQTKSNKPTNKEVTKHQQRGNKEVTPNNNDNNDNNDNKYNNLSSNKFNDDSFEMLTVNYLVSQILKLNPKFKEPNKQIWCKEIDRMRRLDKRSDEDIKRVIKFATEDPFWQKNILSTKKFREKFDTLYIRMNNKNKESSYNNKQSINEFAEMLKGM